MTLIVIHQQNPSPYAQEFVEVDFSQPVQHIPADHIPDYSDLKGIGSGVMPEAGFGRWEDVRQYEGMLPEETHDDWSPTISRWEQDAWDNAVDTDDMQKGPDPWGEDTYQSIFEEAMKVHDRLYSI